ncbi:CIS tube protein [Nitrosomonas supralitoralis]|uniref:Peptidoglycan-binding protein n=1 Tax=Nitrosomonas supralitoralis TaxID=2116706 RepID=A0A2P7NZV3_9PROT|nr:peptidoglycan-binding protein [Nitrosomonas supralitoralis]PSJ18967.1 peptidoglycan-binding protein [Nitrosomonas supralitoralis]
MAARGGAKALLTISPCSVNNGKISIDGSKKQFKALINPAGYEHAFQLYYSKNKVLGQPGAETKYDVSLPEKITLKDLVLDGTGVVKSGRSSSNSIPMSVKDQIELLKNVVYTYLGNKHEAPIVQLKWGKLLFYGRLESLKFDYTLFKPNGAPLRAKVALSFIEYQSSEEISKEAAMQSPDLTHLVEVKAGDTLPLLCYRIYQDSTYYSEVAKINNLTNFRDLKPGIKLQFPPLR